MSCESEFLVLYRDTVLTEDGRGYHVTMLKDATASFSIPAMEAATELIWPMFANRVMTVEEWSSTLK